LVATVIFLVIVFFLLIQIRSVQVFVAQKSAAFLSKKLNTHVSIGSVDVEFFKTVVLEDFYVEDLHHDTLMYAKKLMLNIHTLDFERHKLLINHVDLVNAHVALVNYKSDTTLNLQFIIDAFASNDTTTATDSSHWDFSVNKVTLVNTHFIYQNQHDTSITKGINYSDLDTRDINASISNIHFDADTIYGKIDYLATVEKSGFILKNLSGEAKVSPAGIQKLPLLLI
jgi:hypothetical protein